MSSPALLNPADFPLLVDPSVLYFDSATMTPTPQQVIETIGRFYRVVGGVPNRGAHRFSINATEYQQNSREVLGSFFGVSPSTIIFTSSNTHAANIATHLLPLNQGEGVIFSPVLHHSTLVPWIRRTNQDLIIRSYYPSPQNGRVQVEDITKSIDSTIKVAVLPYASIVYGTITPLAEIIPVLHDHGIRVIVDGTHAVGHIPINLKELDCDVFYCSGNIGMMGPLGTGILYINPNLTDLKEPLLIGDGVAQSVSYHDYTLIPGLARFETGIPNVANQVGLAAAVQYLEKTGIDRIYNYERTLIEQLLTEFMNIPHIQLYGDTKPHDRIGILGFNIEGLHPHDVAMILDESSSIQVRSGLLCAHPFIQCLNEKGVVQLSLHGFNTKDQVSTVQQKLTTIATDLV